jgi:tRNA(fMet)-specific endonuclease VapC
MSAKVALDTSVAIRFLNGDLVITERVLATREIILPVILVGELLFGAEPITKQFLF